jgi:hypothetical protein
MQDMLDFTNFVYNFRIVTMIVTSEQLPVYDKLYVTDDKVKLPLWIVKLYYKNNHCIIEEFEKITESLNSIIANQNLNKQNLVPIEQDFYLLVNDYFNFYIKYKLKYLEINDTISDNEKSQQESEIVTTLKNQQNRFKKLIDMRKKLLLLNCYYGYNRSLVKNMTFEECLIYQNICDTLKNFNENFGYTIHDNI